MWILDPSYQNLVNQVWDSNAGETLGKLELLSNHLVEWNKEVFGNVYARKKRVLARLEGTQNCLDNNPNSRFHQDLLTHLQDEFLLILEQEESLC